MRTLFILQAVLIAIVGAVHIIALRLYLYWLFPWFDIPIHFAGAFWVALAAVWVLAAFHRRTSFMRVLVILVFMSIGWELFELWGGIPREANFVFDTSLDLLMDALGGIFGYFAAERLIMRDVSRGAEGIGEPHAVPRGGEQGKAR